MTLCIFGGTFDPVHVGHLILAQYVLEALKIDRFFFVPCNIPPHKTSIELTSANLRLQMLQLATMNINKIEVSASEIERGGISYTVDTIAHFRQQHQTSKENTFLLIGADSLMDMPKWYQPDQIFKLCSVVVVGRPGFHIKRDGKVAPKPAKIINSPLIEISSSEIRKRIRNGLSVRFMVPDSVLEFIQQHHLYRKENHQS